MTRNWASDNAIGRRIADNVVADILEGNNPTVLAHTIKRMVLRGEWTGVEVGFCHRISERLLL